MRQATYNVKEYIDFFKENTYQAKPLAKLFKTDLNNYIYDTGTNKVLSCEKNEYEILEKIISGELEEIIQLDTKDEKFHEALVNVKQAVEEEDILKAGPNNFKFCSSGHFEEFDKSLNGELDQIILELTEACNLRCGYCIYNDNYEGKRNFGYENMTKEVAKKSIEYAKEHGSKTKGVSVTFYGGEPLINYDLLKYSIEYAKEIITDRELTFSFTTNLTLMTKEKAEYFASVDGLSIACSIDGPEDIHNAYRKDINGVGSFSRAIKGLKSLIEAFGDEAKNRITFSMVFAPPYSEEKLEKINNFFDSLDWLPREIGKIVSYPNVTNINYKEANIANKNNTNKIESPLLRWSKNKYNNGLKGKEDKEFFAKSVVESPLIKIQKRQLFKKCNDKYYLNGCCIPGSRKIYVTIKGNFLVCERIDGSPIIGNIYEGLDKEKIKRELIDDYVKASIKDCSSCWGARMCRVCHGQCYTDKEFDIEKKRYYCNNSRESLLNYLIFYHKCLENDAESLEYMNDVEIF